MRRRDLLRTLTAILVAPKALVARLGATHQARPTRADFSSAWRDWPDINWVGPEYWGNRLQDWRLAGGQAECLVAGRNRALHCLTHRVGTATRRVFLQVTVQRLGPIARQAPANCLGFRIGAKGRRDDYRSAAVYGTGLDVGLAGDGRLRIGGHVADVSVDATSPTRLTFAAERTGATFTLTLIADTAGQPSITVHEIPAETLVGNLALLSHSDEADRAVPSARFDRWEIAGDGLVQEPEAAFGPVCFAHYTLHRGTLKLTAQLTPIEVVPGHRVTLDVNAGGTWRTVDERSVDPLSRTAQFRVERWPYPQDVPYRVRVSLPLAGGVRTFDYAGTIAAEPVGDDRIRVACFSCNADHGFPDADVVEHVASLDPHLAFFVGDQFYESQGGFGIQTSPLEKSCLDYLRKWYMFGWSYRDLFRHRPAAFLPDDHDMYHGNIWGAGGVAAPTDKGWGAVAQDQGGYKMPAAWVNMAQRTQTSHLPDPHDPTPVAQGIGVYYTNWDYGGVSFAILEDRKFKSAPARILPEANVVNGFSQVPGFDHRAHRRLPDAELLGARQQAFLEAWTADWSAGAEFKVVVSQTPFCAAHTLPAGSRSGEEIPSLPVPALGEYVPGDEPAGDMDTNGWPANRRDEALRAMRKGFAFHIAGDQHLASVVRYGIEQFRDAGFAFTVPALNNIWPRRWWPTLAPGHVPLPGAAPYTGDFQDAFGNRITVHAVANPRRTGRDPAIIYDRATGYGIVTFDKAARTIQVECWPRYADPLARPDGQYAGWPLTIHQVDDEAPASGTVLPEIRIAGLQNPVLQVVSESDGETVCTIRVRGSAFRPAVPGPGAYTVRVGDGSRWLRSETGITAAPRGRERPPITIDVR